MSKASDDDVAIIAETEAEPMATAVENKDEEIVEVKDAEKDAIDEVDAETEKKSNETNNEQDSDGDDEENDDVSVINYKNIHLHFVMTEIQKKKNHKPISLHRMLKKVHVLNFLVPVAL